MRQKIGIGFASLAVAMFGVALIAALNEEPDTPTDESSLIADEPIPTDFLNDFDADDEATPAPTKKATTTSNTSRSGSTTRRAAAPAAPAGPTEEPDDNSIPPGYFENSCGGNGSDGSAGGGGGGCGGGNAAPGQQPQPTEETGDNRPDTNQERIAAGAETAETPKRS